VGAGTDGCGRTYGSGVHTLWAIHCPPQEWGSVPCRCGQLLLLGNELCKAEDGRDWCNCSNPAPLVRLISTIHRPYYHCYVDMNIRQAEQWTTLQQRPATRMALPCRWRSRKMPVMPPERRRATSTALLAAEAVGWAMAAALATYVATADHLNIRCALAAVAAGASPPAAVLARRARRALEGDQAVERA
jgi:hypothetical protein